MEVKVKEQNKMLLTRSCGLIIAECNMSHYNGDPDVEDMPRQTVDGYGLISPQCVKHRIRTFLDDHDGIMWEHLKSQFNLSDDEYYIWESRLKGFNVGTAKEAVAEAKKILSKNGEEKICKRYWDIRCFGCTALDDAKDAKMRFIKTGCISISPFITMLPVDIIEQTLTKINPLRSKLIGKNQSDIAPHAMKVARHAVFVGSYVINPVYARRTSTTEKDIDIFKKIFPHCFELSTSSNRNGLRILQIIHADHDNILGSFKEHEFLNFCRPEIINGHLDEDPTPSTSLSDYKLKTIDEIKKKFPKVAISDLCSE